MKKLLVLALVLSMATMANATLILSVGGDTSVTATTITTVPSGTLSLDVFTTVAIQVNTGYNLLVVSTPGGSIPYDQGVVSVTDSGTKFERGGNAHWYLGDSASILPANEEGLGAYADALDAIIPANTKLFDLIPFHCEGPGTTTIKLYEVDPDYTFLTLDDTVVVTQQIPEPMTIGLLGLGGLFLRRRK